MLYFELCEPADRLATVTTIGERNAVIVRVRMLVRIIRETRRDTSRISFRCGGGAIQIRRRMG